jgi:hypothetical protein
MGVANMRGARSLNINRAIISVSAKIIKEDCQFFVKGEMPHERYCVWSKNVLAVREDNDLILMGCKDCPVYKLEKLIKKKKDLRKSFVKKVFL